MAAVATRRGILGSNRYQGTEFNAETCEFSNKDPFLSFFVRSRNAKKSFLYLERFSRILQVISFINFNRITLIFRYKVAQRRCRFRCSKLWIPLAGKKYTYRGRWVIHNPGWRATDVDKSFESGARIKTCPHHKSLPQSNSFASFYDEPSPPSTNELHRFPPFSPSPIYTWFDEWIKFYFSIPAIFIEFARMPFILRSFGKQLL